MSTDQHSDRPLLDARDAFPERGRVSFGTTSLNAMLQRVPELAKQVIPSVAEASVSLIAHDKPGTAAFTGRLAVDPDESQYGPG